MGSEFFARHAAARAAVLGFLAATAVASSACKVTEADVEVWKGTVKGPGKIVAVILADKYDDALRTRAALALVEMERQDVEGIAELQRTLQRLDEGTRQRIIDAMVPQLEQHMKGQGAAQAGAPGGTGAPTALQTRSKDAAFLVIALASPATRLKLTQSIVGWYAEDFNGRSLAGNYSAEQVVRALGTPAATVLVDALTSRLPKEAVVKLSELIGQLGDPATKQRAGERLVQIEREIEAPEFIAWLSSVVRDQLKQNAPNAPVDDARVRQIAELNRENYINDGALPAMKQLASIPAVTERLLEIAESPGVDDKMAERRKRALLALEGNVNRSHLPRLLAIALNTQTPIAVRDNAFQRIGDIKAPEAIPQLWALVSDPGTDDTAQRIRWVASSIVLQTGGTAIVTEFLAKLPSGAAVRYAPEELTEYAKILGQLTPPPTEIMRAQLGSPDWWDRVIALRYFERKGTAADVAQLERLRADAAVVSGPGWEEGFTVGKVAESAIAAMRERLGQGQAPAANPG